MTTRRYPTEAELDTVISRALVHVSPKKERQGAPAFCLKVGREEFYTFQRVDKLNVALECTMGDWERVEVFGNPMKGATIVVG